MSNTTAGLKRKIASAGDLQSVVRSMKALAAASIGQYERSVAATADYYRTVELGLGACFRASPADRMIEHMAQRTNELAVRAVVFGSDQGLVGRFNEDIVEHAAKTLATASSKPMIWAVGEQVQACLMNLQLPVSGLFPVPTSVRAIGPLVGRILVETQRAGGFEQDTELLLFSNQPVSGIRYLQACQRLLPLDQQWRDGLVSQAWPTPLLPEIIGAGQRTLQTLIREYIYVSLFRACAQSLASENASRLAAMDRADRNIDDLLVTMRNRFHQRRQTGIDEEMFDVVTGCEALSVHR